MKSAPFLFYISIFDNEEKESNRTYFRVSFRYAKCPPILNLSPSLMPVVVCPLEHDRTQKWNFDQQINSNDENFTTS